MSILAFPDRTQIFSKDDWYQVGRPRNGLCTPQSSISNDSVDDIDQSPHWDIQKVMSRFEEANLQRSRDGSVAPASEHGSYHQSSYSPPYRHLDNSRPSLPPIRTILGDAVASPPTTPGVGRIVLQPSPREPTYDTSTFRPPSLYPGTRTRPESDWEMRPSRYSPERLPFIETRPPPNVQNVMEKRRDSRIPTEGLQRFGGQSSLSRHDGRSHHPPGYKPIDGESLPTSPSLSHTQSRHRERSPFSERGDRVRYEGSHTTSPYRNQARTYEVQRSPLRVQEQVRQPQPQGYVPHVSPPAAALYSVETAHQHFQPQQGSMTHPPGLYIREEESASGAYAAPEYRVEPAAYFTPSLYEYSNGKPRKRSNLPKQSTEIMKRWFDENIHNPYPTEEQKRHFAAMAGINLTQVSNWFINHRRRCPELKDRRDKNSGSGREEFY